MQTLDGGSHLKIYLFELVVYVHSKKKFFFNYIKRYTEKGHLSATLFLLQRQP